MHVNLHTKFRSWHVTCEEKNQMSIDTLEIEMAQIEMILGNLRTIYYNSSIRKT